MPVAVAVPRELVEALEHRLGGVDRAALARATEELSGRYRSGEEGAPVARSPADVLAYATYRLPATYGAAAAAMLAVREQRPDWQPRTLLDLGAGLGGAGWAGAEVWPALERITAVEAVPEMISLGRGLAGAAASRAVGAAEWIEADLTRPLQLGTHDLVVLSYAAGELAPEALTAVVARAWAAAADSVVVVEPGTPRGYRTVIAVRDALLRAGGSMTGPCPHDAPCPMGGGDWCHFAARVSRTSGHRAAKRATLGHEDEKYSWIAVSRSGRARAEARILRHPQVRSGHVRLELCTPAGLRSTVVSKRSGELYRRARKARWGESFPEVGEALARAQPSELEAGPPTAPG